MSSLKFKYDKLTHINQRYWNNFYWAIAPVSFIYVDGGIMPRQCYHSQYYMVHLHSLINRKLVPKSWILHSGDGKLGGYVKIQQLTAVLSPLLHIITEIWSGRKQMLYTYSSYLSLGRFIVTYKVVFNV